MSEEKENKSEQDPGPGGENGRPSRRTFLERIGAGALAGAAIAAGIAGGQLEPPAEAGTSPAPPPQWPELDPNFSGAPSAEFLASGEPLYAGSVNQYPMAPPHIPNPNLLIIMVDQLWNDLWLPAVNGNPSVGPIDKLCPTLTFLRENSFRFLNYYTVACSCTPSRAAMLTGLYPPHNCTFITQVANEAYGPDLHIMSSGAGFSTFGTALRNPNVVPTPYKTYWCGKWHVSDHNGSLAEQDLTGYGFDRLDPTRFPRMAPPTKASSRQMGEPGLGARPRNRQAARHRLIRAPHSPTGTMSPTRISRPPSSADFSRLRARPRPRGARL